MENLFANADRKGVNFYDDEKRRLPNRPQQAPVSKYGGETTRRKGQAVEDLGSSFVKGGASGDTWKAKVNGRRPQTRSSQLHDPVHSDSEDEMDCLSSSQLESDSDTGSRVRKKSKGKGKEELGQKGGVTDDNGKFHKFHPNFQPKKKGLNGLKFNKIKKTMGDPSDSTPSNASSSTLPISKEQWTNRQLLSTSFGGSTAPQKEDSQTSFELSPNPFPRSTCNRSPSPTRHMPTAHFPKRTQGRTAVENTRPQPRPLRRAADTQQKTQPLSDIGIPDNDVSSPTRRHIGPLPFPLSLTQSENIGTAKTRQSPPVEKLAPAAFPLLSPMASPVRSSEFPSLTPLASQENRGIKKPSYLNAKRKGTITQVLPTTPMPAKGKIAKDVSAFPMLSPLSSLAISANEERAGKFRLKQKDRSGYRRETDGSDIKELHGSSNQPKAQPFPMSTQVLYSIGSPDTPPTPGPSRLGKRSSSDGSDNEQKRKRTRKDKGDEEIELMPLDDYAYDENDDTLMISPSTDPRTLCPYCDSPLPASPTSLLTRLLTATAKKSSQDPRPTNPLGRKAPFAVFIAVCQRHRFESEILPEAEQKGWPKEIEWTELGGRVGKMRRRLKALIDDAGEGLQGGSGCDEKHDEDCLFTDEEENFGSRINKRERGSRSKCVFWGEVMAEVKKKGSRAVAGVRGQFASFEKTQPGYYGELGSVIIHQTLYDLFPPASIDPNLISPLTVNEFIQRILVPEVGVRLIMEDQELEGEEGMETAVRILRESASYGVAMFPEDGGEWDVGGSERGNGRRGRKGGVDEEMGVADRIVMERARKRRKELEEEEGGMEMEMEMGELQVISDMDIDGKQKKPNSRRKKGPDLSKKGKAKEVDPAPVIVPRPKPRPLGKTSSSASVLASGTDFDTTPHESQSVEEAIDSEVAEMVAPLEPRQKRKPSKRHSPTVSDLEQRTDTESETENTTRLAAAISSGSTFLDLCSLDNDAESQDGKIAGRVTRTRKRLAKVGTTKRPAPEPISVVKDAEDDSVELVIPLETPVAKRIRQVLVEHDDELEETPRLPGSSYVLRTPSANDSLFVPLMAARERGTRSGTASDTCPSTPAPASRDTAYSWLLSDSSQSAESHEQ